jgi:hypothetical protein
MLPNFLVIGAQKTGTTWLAKCLGEHPDILVPEVKEVCFFDRHFTPPSLNALVSKKYLSTGRGQEQMALCKRQLDLPSHSESIRRVRKEVLSPTISSNRPAKAMP